MIIYDNGSRVTGVDAKQSLEQAASHLARACNIEETAKRDLPTARQSLLSSEQEVNATPGPWLRWHMESTSLLPNVPANSPLGSLTWLFMDSFT
jgi:hypothetical protein